MSKSVFFRTGYNYDTDLVSRETGLVCDDDSLAVQSERDEVDINTIVRRFGLTGELPSNLAMPQSGDFTGITDYHDALNKVLFAQSEFLKIPAEIRARFDNDPGRFVSFFEDPANLPELRAMGFAKDLPPGKQDQAKPDVAAPAA